MRFIPCSIALTTCLLACSRGGSTLGTTPLKATTGKDGNVAVMTHPADAFEHAPRLGVDTAGVIAFGPNTVGTAFDLASVYNIVMMRDGRFAAFPQAGTTLMIFAANGAPEHLYGKSGVAAGEFMRVRGILEGKGDTLLIPDEGNSRLNWLTPDKGVVLTAVMQNTSGKSASGFRSVGMLPDGRMIGYSPMIPQPDKDSAGRYLMPVSVFAPKGDRLQDVTLLPGPVLPMIETRYKGVKRDEPVIPRFTRLPQAIVWDTLIVTSAGERYELDLRSAAGTLVSRISVPVPRRPVTQAMRDAEIKAAMDRLVTTSEGLVDPQESIRLIREAPFADSLPPLGALFVTPDRTLWVVDPIAPSDSTWDATAFRPDGAIAGRLHVGTRGRPVAFGNDRVAVRSEDAKGVAMIRVYRITAAKP